MGQHKHNPVAILAKQGRLPEKPKRLTKAQSDRAMERKCERVLGINQLMRDFADYNGRWGD